MTQSREDVIKQDVQDLHKLGYAQELFRNMGGFSNFAISFSIISILTGAVILYDYGLAWAGTAAALLGWPLITIFVLLIAASMSEIASAYPTAGGLYYWASKMKNKAWGWWTAWFNLIGQFAIVAGINWAAANFLNVTLVTPILAGLGITYDNTTVVLAIGESAILTGALVTMGILMLVELGLNIVGINVVAILNQVSVWWHIVVVLAIVVLLLLLGQPNASGLTLFAIQPQDTVSVWDNTFPPAGWPGADTPIFSLNYGPAVTYPLMLAFFFSLLQANWTYTGYDASAHVAEETVGARVASAWGVFLSVAVSAVFGYIMLVAMSLHLPDLSTLFPAELTDAATYSQYYFGGGYAVISILEYNLNSIIILNWPLGDILGAAIAIAMAFCGLSSVAAASRMLFAFSRDDGVPGSGWLKKVSHRYRTPANALIGIVVVAWLFSVVAFIVGTGVAIVIITAISTIFLYAAYGICIYLGATTSEWLTERKWSLGRYSKPVAWVAIFWVIVLMILFSWPTSGNISWPFMVAIVLFLLIYYYAWARKRFEGPKVQGTVAELTEIEKEFESAAEQLRA